MVLILLQGMRWRVGCVAMTENGPERELGVDADVLRLFAGLRGGDIRALARAVSLVEDGAAEAAGLLALCRAAAGQLPGALRVGLTGPPGAGKSTLVDGLVRELRRGQGRRVGIVAVDPSSAFTGGAILGDRIRFAGEDAGVYFRSMATRGHLGGLAAATEDVLTVMEAAGFDVLLIETTGVGQGEIEVVGLADVVAVVLVPGMGDSIQGLKAGVLEIADVFVLNKADVVGVEKLEAEILEVVVLSGKAVPVVKTVATMGEGIAELLGVLDGLGEKVASGAEAPIRSGGRLYGLKPVPFESERNFGGLKLGDAGSGATALDHLGIAVRSIAEAGRLYEALGVVVSGVEEVAQERVRVAMLAVGESRIELLEATGSDSAVARFIEKRGEGLHHVALRVPDLAAVVERLRGLGVRLVSDAIQVGAGGHRYVFVHPSSANGVLLELVEAGN